ncbi:MAG: single-stranded DNA-binding protein [Thermoleophilia bacterium]
MNSVNLIGRLTKDPETRMTGGGTTVSDLRIAVNRPGRDEEPHYFTVVAYGKLADVCGEHLESGREVAVSGRLEYREWTNDQGDKRSKVEVVASQIDFLRSAGTKSEAPAEEEIAF